MKMLTAPPSRVVKLLATGLLLMSGYATQAAVMQYSLASFSDYGRDNVDTSLDLPVTFDIGASVSGSVSVDTTTGELVSAIITVANYSETFNYAPFSPGTNFATLQFSDEQHSLSAAGFGTVNGTVISFSGANSWTDSVSGSASCSGSAGVEGDALCGGAALPDWGSFAIDLDFSDDFSFFSAVTSWSTTDGNIRQDHSLNFLGTSEVPLPAGLWLMLSALGGLAGVKSLRCRSFK